MGLTAVIEQSDIIRLRRTTVDDLDVVLRTEQDKDNSPFVGQWTRERHEDTLTRQDMAHLIIETVRDSRTVGYAIMAGLDNVNQSVELRRIAIADKGNGYGRAALRLVKRFAFESLGAHRLWLDVRDHNLRARHVYESEGFVVEGILRECIRLEERFESLVVMSVLVNEYIR